MVAFRARHGASRMRAATWFHREITLARVATAVGVLFVVLLATLLPWIITRENQRYSDHRDLGQQRAEDLVGFLDQQILQMSGASRILHGFVSSAAPLTVPNYAVDNATDRARKALTPATAGALSLASYNRTERIISTTFVGYRNAAVHAGFVTMFTDTAAILGQDVLASPSRDEFVYMVNTTDNLIRLPRLAVGTFAEFNDNVYLVIRSPVFSNESELVRDPSAIDPLTGTHPNWKYAWGAISMVMEMRTFAASPILAQRAQGFEWKLFTYATVHQGLYYPEVVVANTTRDSAIDDNHPACDCSKVRFFSATCVCVVPANCEPWRGNNVKLYIAVVTVGSFIGPLLLVLSMYGLVRLIVGPTPDPLKYAPRRLPVHAVCVDLPDANRMWSEVPFIMHDVTMTFGDHVDRLAAEHRVYVTMRLGCTAVAVSSSRERVVAFARAFAEWAQNFAWPPHIMVHCPRGSLHFAVMLHTMENVTVRIDREQGQCDVTGDDMKALLLLRVAAVEQHVMCTGEFLGLPSLYARIVDRRELDALEGVIINRPSTQSNSVHAQVSDAARHDARSTNDESNNHLDTSTDIIRFVGNVGELGVVSLPMTFAATGEQCSLRGYLLPSAATHGRDINDVLDSFPDRVWSEWISARAFDTQDHFADHEAAQRPSVNPLLNSAVNSIAGLGRSGGNSQGANGSRTGQMKQNADRQKVTGAHLNNDSADAFLPGSVADLTDQRRLLQALIPVIGRGEGGTVGSYMTSAPTMLTSHTQALLEERHGPLLAALSVATYYLSAYRIVFAPLEPEVRQAMVARICAAVGVGSEDYSLGLAVRCTRLSMRYICPNEPGAATRSPGAPRPY